MDLEQRIADLKFRIAQANAIVRSKADDEPIGEPAGLRNEFSAGGTECLQGGSGAQAKVRNHENGSGVDGETLRAQIARARQASRYR